MKKTLQLLLDSEDVELSGFFDHEIIAKLDSLENNGNFYKKYSEIYQGGVYSLNSKNRKENPDWMSQSANSFREIFYLLTNNNKIELQKVLSSYLGKSLTRKEADKYKNYINNLYSFFSDLTHHFSNPEREEYVVGERYVLKSNNLSKEEYFQAIRYYKEYLKIMIATALDIHKKIDYCIENNKKNKDQIKVLLNNSKDSKLYFFSKIDDDWLGWIWEKGFLAEIKNKLINQNQKSYIIPELEYLFRCVKTVPEKVAEIIKSVPISEHTFNPEVVVRFLWMIEEMPAEQIKTLLPKIKEENWIYLMRKFNKSGYQFHKIIEKLDKTKDESALLDIAEIILTVQDIESGKKRYNVDSLFALDHINEVGIFDVLVNISEEKAEDALKLSLIKLSEIIKQSGKDDDKIFEYEGYYSLFDANIFTLNLDRGGAFGREDFENLIAVIKKLIERLVGKKCGEPDKAKELLGLVFDLPDSRLTWRVKLFALAQYPEVFQDEIEKALNRVFRVGERYLEIEGGAEYHELLIKSFYALDESYQRKYVGNIFNYFNAKLDDEDKEKWRRCDGGKILCLIGKWLSEQEIEEAKKVFEVDPLKSECKPEPASSGIRSGLAVSLPPEDISKMPVPEIIEKLKDDYRPEKLNKKYKHDDIFKSRNAEGVGDALKNDIKNRAEEYFENLEHFFDDNNISSHYVYSILRGIEEILRENKKLNKDQVCEIISLFTKIKLYGKDHKFEHVKTGGIMWLADWVAVHRSIADVILQLFREKEHIKLLMKENKTELLEIIEYLLRMEDRPSLNEEKNKETDLFNLAINSVRGRSFEAFVMFMQNDGKELRDDSKEIFKQVLKDTSLAVRFILGRYIASFYFRDKKFIHDLWPEIFPLDNKDKKDIYLATWEGYLSNTLYSVLFDELSDYYSKAIQLDPSEYTDRKYHKSLDEALAVHMALSFAHLNLKIGDPLFDEFWSKQNSKRHHEFISFIGRSCLSRSQAGDEWFKKNNVSKKKLIEFWNWALENIDDREALSGFGFWVNYETEVIEDKIVADRMAKTMIKSNGLIDWDYGLMRRLSSLANIDHHNTFLIIKHYLLDESGDLNPDRKSWGLHTGRVKQALEIIYKKGDSGIKSQVEDLVANLIDKGSSTFWELKEIIK